jgi:hypothetical protein
MRGLLAAVCLATLVAAGCSSGSGRPVTVTGGTTTTTVEATTTTTEAATTIPTTTSTLALPSIGDPVHTTGGNTLTVHTLEAPARPNRTMILKVDPGMQFTVVDVEACVSASTSASVTWSESMWSVETTDHRRWSFWNVQDYAKAPDFGFPSVSPGRCSRGWITFQTPAAQAIAAVDWQDDTSTQTYTWTVRPA